MRRIGGFGYSLIGLFTVLIGIAFIRAGVIGFIHSTTEDWIWICGTLLGISIVSILSYWIGRGVVYLLSLLN